MLDIEIFLRASFTKDTCKRMIQYLFDKRYFYNFICFQICFDPTKHEIITNLLHILCYFKRCIFFHCLVTALLLSSPGLYRLGHGINGSTSVLNSSKTETVSECHRKCRTNSDCFYLNYNFNTKACYLRRNAQIDAVPDRPATIIAKNCESINHIWPEMPKDTLNNAKWSCKDLSSTKATTIATTTITTAVQEALITSITISRATPNAMMSQAPSSTPHPWSDTTLR